MKKIKIILLLLCIITFNRLHSQTLEAHIADKDYLQCLSSLVEDANSDEKLKSASNAQIRRLAKIAYEAFEQDPIKVWKYIYKKNQEWGQMVKNDKTQMSKPRMGNLQGTIWDLIEQNLSTRTYELVRIPYFIKGKVVSKETLTYTDQSTGNSHPKNNVVIKVEDVLKGHSRFEKDDEIEFFYFSYWDKPKKEFKIGESYLLPLEPRCDEDIDNYSWIALVTYIENPDVVFEFQNDFLFDEYNYFDFGTSVEWDSFKHQFNAFVNSNIRETIFLHEEIKEGN